MNAKLILTAVALALLGSTNVFADQAFGRSSVFVTPGGTPSKASTVVVNPHPGRSSVYVGDVVTPPRKSTVADTLLLKPGRA